MEDSRISVIIPAHNEEKYIANALKSIEKQTHLEKIVVVNDSTDDTAKIAKQSGAYVIETPIKGISNAKNIGARYAKGGVFAFMDADSQAKEDLLEKVYQSIKKGYNCGKTEIMPLDDIRLRAYLLCTFSGIVSTATLKFPWFECGAGPFIFTTRDVFKKIKAKYGSGFRADLQVMEDVDFLTKLKKEGNYKFITDSCVYTSMRRYTDEGYIKCIVEDIIHFFDPVGKTRERWNR